MFIFLTLPSGPQRLVNLENVLYFEPNNDPYNSQFTQVVISKEHKYIVTESLKTIAELVGSFQNYKKETKIESSKI